MEKFWWFKWTIDNKIIIDWLTNSRVNELLTEFKDDEIRKEEEYNEYILEEMIEFINDVIVNKEMMSINLIWSEFLQSYKYIIDFLSKNSQIIKEIWVNDEMLVLANNLFFHYSKWNFNSLQSYENLITENIRKSFENSWIKFKWIDFTEEFYDELKDSLIKLIKVINELYIIKKNS